MIGVCIRYFHENYGGMLQAFATIKLLEKNGYDYEIIRYNKKKDLKFVLKSLPRVFNRILINDKKEAFQKKLSFKKHPEFAEKDKIRMAAFNRFREREFQKLSKINNGYAALKENALKYDVVLTGSDQLWSPAGLPTNFYNLMFAPDNVKKVSYASSFGVKYIPWYQKNRTAEFLKRLDCISMRENAGKEIVKDLTDKDVPVVLDPVFLFNEKEWKELIPEKEMYKEDYIFAYFLGKNEEHRDAVKELAKKTGLKIVTLKHLDQFVEYDEKFGDYAPYDVEPSDFLNLLRGAKYVCTDSYHGAVFSIINKKRFVIFNRYADNAKHSKNSRIDTLCANMQIYNCRYDGDINNIINQKIDYEKVDKIYNGLRKKSEEYLNNALKKI